jgi:hypothetical protein
VSGKRRQVRFLFTVKVDGKTYKCERLVTGTRVLSQTVHVEGIVRTENDPARYGGPMGHSIASMEFTAKVIAGIMIQDKRKG